MELTMLEQDSRGAQKIRVLLISSIVPGNSGGGGVVLRRHLAAAEEFELLVISDGKVPGFKHVVIPHRLHSRLLKRLSDGWFSKWACSLQEFFFPCSRGQISSICRQFRPNVILTVAHGGIARMALAESSSLQIPLVTIFHDWWPDLSGVHRVARLYFDRGVRQLAKESAATLCVSEGMLLALGRHSAAEVMYPIPALHDPELPDYEENYNEEGPLKVAYMGNLGDYGEMVKMAIDECLDRPAVRIEVCGRQTVWCPKFENKVRQLGLWHGFLPDDLLRSWLASVDVFLVVMRFQKRLRRFMETSFPSKIPEYAQYHKPIVVWGPDYCSAVRWARESGAALCVTDPSASVLVDRLESLSSAERKFYADKSREVAAGEFNPARIQKQFVATIRRAAAPRVS